MTKNSAPSSEFAHEDRCPSCGIPCNIHTDLDDKDYCNDFRPLVSNRRTKDLKFSSTTYSEKTPKNTAPPVPPPPVIP